MTPAQRALERIRGHQHSVIRVVFPEGDDARIQDAASRLPMLSPTIKPVLIGKGDAINGAETLDPGSWDHVDELAAAYASHRPGTSLALASRAIRKPMYFAGMLLQQGRAHAMVAGVTCPTARVIEAAMLTVGLQANVAAPSSFFIMQFADRALVFADCAVNVSPDVETLAAIGIASASSCKSLLGVEPRVAFLSFSTRGSANHEAARNVRDASALAQTLRPDVSFDGELQADAALVPRVAALKVSAGSPVAGQANVLVFPDLNAANIAYKLVQHLGGAKALGPFLQGFAAPVSDLSRGATVDDIVETAILTAARAIP
jgi:phosphate acetyltransferase